MKPLIIGASRGIGLNLLEQSLKAGHAVTAFVRHPQKIPLTHEGLRLVAGDNLDGP